ncbi:MAG: LysM peptidoglycan-binding domain-containing protein [Actinomycetota bacterium]|nr:LysM peptidoglycan-binding domain-containing protein [Actinomycetota bacterium]
MRSRLRAAVALAAWLAFLVGGVAVLHALGARLPPPSLSSPPGGAVWLMQHQPAEVALSILRLMALALGWYLLVVTLGALVARLLRLATLTSVVDAVTLPAVRRMVSGAVGLSLVATSFPVLGSVAGAQGEPPAVETMRRLPDGAPPAGPSSPPPTMRRVPDAQSPAKSPAPPAKAPAPSPAKAPAPPSPSPAPGSWTVRPGDHFWAVAERVLTDAWGRVPADGEVDPYWRALVKANQARLRDPRNPDLLFTGQTLAVPPPPPLRTSPAPPP